LNSRRDPDWIPRVRPIVRARVGSGLLRSAPARQTWIGPGVNNPCDACDSLIESDDTEIDIYFIDGRTLRLHIACHTVWQQEQQLGPTA